MLTADKVLDRYYLDVRCMLLEIAATLDRFERAEPGAASGNSAGEPRLERIYRSLAILADRRAGPERAKRLLDLFSAPAD